MNIQVEKEKILEALQDVTLAIPSRTTLPILSNLLLEVEQGKIKITATDLETCIKKELSAEIEKEGKITVPGKKFYDILREIPVSEISIEKVKNTGVIVKGKRSYFKLLGFSAEEYPEIPRVEGKTIEIPSQVLYRMITTTYFACSHEETRYTLNGILFDFRRKKLRLVASDGRRLALREEKVDSGWEGKYIVPQKAVTELLHIINNTQGDVKIIISSKNDQISFNYNNTELITRLIEGEFPNYEEVVPKECSNKLQINKEDFYQIIKRVSLMTTSDSLAIKLEVHKDKLVVSKITPELGEAREEIESRYTGEEMVVGFNPQYLLDVLKNIDEEEIVFELNGPDKPGVLRFDSEFIYLVLPMQLI